MTNCTKRGKNLSKSAVFRHKRGLASKKARVTRPKGLRYVTDSMPGIRRKRMGRGFTYVGVERRFRDVFEFVE